MSQKMRVSLWVGDKEALHAELPVDIMPDHIAERRVQISIGGDHCRGSVTVPVDLLSVLMARVLADDARRAPGIIMPEQGIIVPK